MHRETSLGPELYLGAEGLEHVGAAGLAGRRPVAVLGDRYAGAAGHEGGGGGDVYGALRVAAGAAGVDDVLRGLDARGEAAHRAGEADDLGHRLAAHSERGEQGRGDGRGTPRPP